MGKPNATRIARNIFFPVCANPILNKQVSSRNTSKRGKNPYFEVLRESPNSVNLLSNMCKHRKFLRCTSREFIGFLTRYYYPAALIAVLVSLIFGPISLRCSEEFLLILFYLPDEFLIAGVFVCGCPENQFRKDGSKINSFLCKRINTLSSVR